MRQILSMAGQARSFLITALAGFLTGLIFDLFRVLRKAFRHPDFLTQLEDVLFWLLAVAAVFSLWFRFRGDSDTRVFSLVGVFLGMILYFAALSRLARLVLGALTELIKRTLTMAAKIVSAPFRAAFQALYGLAAFGYVKAKKPMRAAKKNLLNARRCASMWVKQQRKNFVIMKKKV